MLIRCEPLNGSLFAVESVEPIPGQAECSVFEVKRNQEKSHHHSPGPGVHEPRQASPPSAISVDGSEGPKAIHPKHAPSTSTASISPRTRKRRIFQRSREFASPNVCAPEAPCGMIVVLPEES